MNEDAAEEQVRVQEAALGVGWAQGRMAAGRRRADQAVPVVVAYLSLHHPLTCTAPV